MDELRRDAQRVENAVANTTGPNGAVSIYFSLAAWEELLAARDALRAVLDAGRTTGVTAPQVIEWLKSRPGVSWVATVRDVEEAVATIAAALPNSPSLPHTGEAIDVPEVDEHGRPKGGYDD